MAVSREFARPARRSCPATTPTVDLASPVDRPGNAPMPILGFGIDLVHLPRFAALVGRRGPQLGRRILSSEETRLLATVQTQEASARFLAVRYDYPVLILRVSELKGTFAEEKGLRATGGQPKKPCTRLSSQPTLRPGRTSRSSPTPPPRPSRNSPSVQRVRSQRRD